MEESLRSAVYLYQNDICQLNRMRLYSKNYEDREYFMNLLQERTEVFIEHMQSIQAQEVQTPAQNATNENGTTEAGTPLREFTSAELEQYDGKNGNPPYVAVDGIVYDLTGKRAWMSGNHFGLSPGKNLTSQFRSCHRIAPHVLDNLPRVGILK